MIISAFIVFSRGNSNDKIVNGNCLTGKDVVSGGGSLGAPTMITPLQAATVGVSPAGTPSGDALPVMPGSGVVGGSHAGVTSSQLYLLDSSYDLDLDSIDGSVSQPSHSESSQLGLIHSNAV